MKDCRYVDACLYCVCKLYVRINVISWIMLAIWVVASVLTYGLSEYVVMSSWLACSAECRLVPFWLGSLFGMPSTWPFLNCVKKNILCCCVFIDNLIFQFRFFVYMKFFKCAHHFSFLYSM